MGTHFKITLLSNDIEIPETAVIQHQYVFVIKNGKIRKREISYKKSSKGGYIIVNKGLSIDEQVVKAPSSKMIKLYIN